MKQSASISLELIAASCLLVGVVVVCVVLLSGPTPATARTTPATQPLVVASANPSDDSEPTYIGLTQGGCAASTCHGQPTGQKPAWQNAALIFERDDPHANAYEVLFSERSKQMLERLTRQEFTAIEPYLAELENRCIGCHATPLPPGVNSSSPAGLAALAQGVSCEACHGPASKWRNAHLTKAGLDPNHDYPWAGEGFNSLGSSLELAATCVTCHIGTEGKAKQVTHDLIAVGHPKLDIEVSAWRNKLPPHWAKKPATQSVALHTARWTSGQLAVARQREHLANEQLRGATENSQTSQWPEFAHLECASCHQSLRIADFSSPRTSADSIRVAEHLWLGQIAMPDRLSDHALTTAFLTGNPLETSLQQKQRELEDLFNYNFLKYIGGSRIKTDQLAKLLIDHRSEIDSWDRLIAWIYAAQAVLRDVEEAKMEPVTQLRDSLQKLSEHIDACVTSRYASPQMRPLDAASERVQQIQEDLKQVADALAALFPTNP